MVFVAIALLTLVGGIAYVGVILTDATCCIICRRGSLAATLMPDASGREMLGVPIGLEIGIDLAVDHEDARRPFSDPGLDRFEVGKRPHRCAARPVAAGDGRKSVSGNRTMSTDKPWRRK